jgi:hypothetical protein
MSGRAALKVHAPLPQADVGDELADRSGTGPKDSRSAGAFLDTLERSLHAVLGLGLA